MRESRAVKAHRKNIERLEATTDFGSGQPTVERDGSDDRTDAEREGSGDQESDVDEYELIWRLAGLVGVDPLPFSFRELVRMAEGRQELEWDLSNNVMAQVVNQGNAICETTVKINGGKAKPKKPVDFTKINPYRL